MIARDEYFNDLISFKDKILLKVVTGIRRFGKSTMFELYQSYLLEQSVKETQIITVNLEDGDYRHLRTTDALYEHISQQLISGDTNYVFIDEVQKVPNFEEAVDWL